MSWKTRHLPTRNMFDAFKAYKKAKVGLNELIRSQVDDGGAGLGFLIETQADIKKFKKLLADFVEGKSSIKKATPKKTEKKVESKKKATPKKVTNVP